MKDNATADNFRNEGNAFFQQSKFYEALISYNKSLCHAAPKSSQLGLAYANRSAVYLELKQLDKCLNNIQLAKDNNYPNQAKLQEREKKCMEQLKTRQPESTKNDPWAHFKLSYPANKKIPFIVDCLEPGTNEKYGRHIVTNRNLNPGDVIAIEEPIFKGLYENALYSKCVFCFKSNMLNLIPCSYEDDASVCTMAMYCDQECLTKARDRFHGAYCREVESLFLGCDKSTIVSAIHTFKGPLESLFIVKDPQNLQNLMNSNKQTTVFDYDLSNQQDDPSADFKRLSILNNLGVGLGKSHESKCEYFSSRLVKDFSKFSRIRRENPGLVSVLVEYSTRLEMIGLLNSIGVKVREQLVGYVVLALATLYSHSCDANVFILHIENKFVHIVMKPIKKSEQVCLSYGPHFSARPDPAQRQEFLFKRFKFKCSCPACLTDYVTLSRRMRDPHFILDFPMSASGFPAEIDGKMIELKKRFKYIKDNFKKYPSSELCISIARCTYLFTSIENESLWPF